MYRLELELTKKPKSLNRKLRSHRFQNHAENQRWDTYLQLVTARKRPIAPLQKCKLWFEWGYYRSMDFDGIVGALKPVVDGLIHAGIIADDSWKVTGPWEINQVFRPKDHGFLLRVRVSEDIEPSS